MSSPFENKAALREHLVWLTKELVRFPSHMQEPLRIFELMEYIKAYFESDRLNITSHVKNGFPSMVITFEETKHPFLLLAGHVDVVPSSTKFVAEEDLTVPGIPGGVLRGSGVMDMKGGVAVMMALMKYFGRQEKRPSLGLMLTSDEEIGGENGTLELLRQGYRANFAIVNEGREKYNLVIREKGTLTLKFSKTGNFIHSAYPWKSANVLQELMQVMLDAVKLFPKPSDRWVTTASITSMHGGREMNTIPGEAEAFLNIRFTGGERFSREAIIERIRARIPKDVEITEMLHGRVFEQDAENEHVKLLRKIGSEVSGRKMLLSENHGASDARHFQEHNVPTVILGPAGKFHHTPNEYVEIESLLTHYEVLRRFVEAF